jgi:hypothetical protein
LGKIVIKLRAVLFLGLENRKSVFYVTEPKEFVVKIYGGKNDS